MDSQIQYRAFKKSDEEFIVNMIREAWHYDDMCSSKTARKMAQAFLKSCLTNQTYTQVALINDQPIGIIMGNDIKQHRCSLRDKFQQIIAIVRVLLDREGRKIANLFQNVNRIDQELLEESHKDYQGELSFFVMHSKYRGMGIGKQLFSRLLTYMKNHQVDCFYLYTDTSCHYYFYERQGMKRRAQKSQTLTIKGYQTKMQFFIYDYDLSQK